MACLDAVASGSTSCEDGLVTEQQYASKDLGVDPTSFFIFDGAGSDDRDRSAGSAMTQLLRGVDAQPYAAAFEDALPVLGVNGDLANQGLGTPPSDTSRARRAPERPSSRPASDW
jgi:D-alanyl-D-alanine carboxypeptidase